MFDLFRSRDRAVRYLLGAFLLLVALSMLTYLVPNYGMTDAASGEVVADVGGEKLTLLEVQRTIQNFLRGQSVPPALMATYIPQLVDQLINERALAYEARRAGFQVSDADVASTIRSTIPSLFPEGRFLGQETYAGMLSQQNLTVAEFEETIVRQILASRLRALAVEGTVVAPQEVEAEYRQRNAKAKIEWVRVPEDKYRSEIQVSEAELRKAFEGMKDRLRSPERRSAEILIAEQDKIAKQVEAPESELRRAYEQDKDRFRSGERVKIRHILFSTASKPKEEEPKIRARGEEVLKQIRGGADFAGLARQHSEDPGSAAKGGDLDWVVRGQMVPEFEKAAFSLKPKEISQLVKTNYGYHIVQMLDRQEAQLKPFSEVKEQLATELNQQRVNDLVQQTADRARAALRRGQPAPQVASELGLELIRAGRVAQRDTPAGVPAELKAVIFETAKGEASEPVLLPGNKLAVVRVSEIEPPGAARFEESQEQIQQALLADRRKEVLNRKAQELLDKAKALNGDLRKAAESMGLEVKTSSEFTRQGAVEGLGTASLVIDAFTKPVGTVFGPIDAQEARVVSKVIARAEPPPAELEAQREAIRTELKNKKERDRAVLFEYGVREQLVKEGKLKIHQDVVRRFTGSFRG